MDYPMVDKPLPKKRKPRPLWPGVLAVLLFWGGLIYGGFYYAKEYIDCSIQSVQETNAMQIQGLEERLSAIQSEMESIEDALKDTDKTLSSSDATRQDLSKKIEALDEQLQRLEKSLNILKEAPGNR